MNWCFAIINNRLAELYFEEKDHNVTHLGHAYIKITKEYTKKERQTIAEDTKNHRFMYRNGTYRKMPPE